MIDSLLTRWYQHLRTTTIDYRKTVVMLKIVGILFLFPLYDIKNDILFIIIFRKQSLLHHKFLHLKR